MNYATIRNLYYFGIMCLVVYALPKVNLVQTYLYPIFTYEPVSGFPIIAMVAIGTGVGAAAAYFYRILG